MEQLPVTNLSQPHASDLILLATTILKGSKPQITATTLENSDIMPPLGSQATPIKQSPVTNLISTSSDFNTACHHDPQGSKPPPSVQIVAKAPTSFHCWGVKPPPWSNYQSLYYCKGVSYSCDHDCQPLCCCRSVSYTLSNNAVAYSTSIPYIERSVTVLGIA